MENRLENLAENNETNTDESFTNRFDRFVDSDLGIATLVLGTIPAYYAGSYALGPVAELVLSSATGMLGGNSVSIDTDSVNMNGYLGGLAGIAIFGKVMGNVIAECRNRIQNCVPEKFEDYDSGFFKKVFYSYEIKIGLKKVADYLYREKSVSA